MFRARCQNMSSLPSIPLEGDSIFQLKDGKIISYFFRDNSNLILYDQNSFKKLIEIELGKIIKCEKIKFKYDKENLKKEFDNYYYHFENESEEEKEKRLERYCIRQLLSKGIISIIQQINGNLLVAFSQLIFDINILENSFNYKVYQKEENILSINELSDNKILIITGDNIQVLIKENNNFITKEKYLIDEKWKIEPQSKKHRFYGKFKQYFDSYILPKERLLLNSFSTEWRLWDSSSSRIFAFKNNFY